MIERVIRRFWKDGRGETEQEYPDLPKVGETASDFLLPATCTPGKDDDQFKVALTDLRGNPAVLVFYPADNSRVCSSQLALYNEALHLVKEHNAQLVAISTDTAGAVANDYGVLNPNDGLCERAIFVLDSNGRIRWRAVYPRKINPGMDGILEALESMTSIKENQ
jgi:alkyl hydroperoxide reductase subunit AhpC